MLLWSKKRNVKMQAGDVVKLKSGSPEMTIRKIEDGKVDVIWFEPLGKKLFGHERHSTIPEACLNFVRGHVEK